MPSALAKGAPLVVVLHGSGESGARMRPATGYGFERLADEHGFAVVYPDGFEGYWNACNIVGDYSANKLNIDDVGFLSALADKLGAELVSDPARVFATGISRGGHMAFRLALEAPSHFRTVAAVAANVPAPENFKCKPGPASASVLIMNGTKDPLNPFDGGDVNLFGFIKRGKVLSSRASGQYSPTSTTSWARRLRARPRSRTGSASKRFCGGARRRSRSSLMPFTAAATSSRSPIGAIRGCSARHPRSRTGRR